MNLQSDLCIQEYIEVMAWLTERCLFLSNNILFWILFCWSSHSPVEREMLEGDSEVEGEKEPSGRREKPVVRLEEIPPVPENRFLLRRDMPSQEDKTEMSVKK